MFESSVLSEVETQEEANALEQHYIKLYNSIDPACGYNIALGGYAGCVDDESRKIISEKAKQRYKDPTKNPMYGKKHSKEAISKMSLAKQGEKNPMYGRKWNDNQRAKCGKHGWHYEMTPEQKRQVGERARRDFSKPILCVETGEHFSSITDAAKRNRVSIATLSGHLNGRQHTCAGKHFTFVGKDKSQTTNSTVEISTTGSGKRP